MMVPTLEQSNLGSAIQQALEQARQVTATQGFDAQETAVAWDIVEELQAEASHRQHHHPKSAFEQYCEEFPGAIEARIYDD